MARVRARRMTRVGALAALGLSLALAGCDDGPFARLRLKPEEIIVERRPDPRYEMLFPHYVELCSVSQWHDKFGRRGNPFGHALIYIKGACRDETAPIPKLRRCHAVATSTDDPEHGAAVSVNRWLRNVNFIVVPGYNLVFSGDLAPGEPLTTVHRDATAQKAIALGVYNGVELHDGWTTGEDRSLTAFVTRHSVAVDFALQFSRNVFCARVPVPEPALDEMIAFFNDKNTEYATGKADYNWNLLADNCVHTVRNALAAANVWAPISAGETKLRALFQLAVPANEFVNLGLLGAEGPLADYREIADEEPARDALHEFRWLPTRHGALVKTLPVHEPNEVYHTRFRLFALQSPITRGKTANAVRLLSDPRFVSLPDNLLYFRDVYDGILADHEQVREPLASVRGTPYRRISRLHLDYIRSQRDEVEKMLQQIEAYDAVPGADKGEFSPLGAAATAGGDDD